MPRNQCSGARYFVGRTALPPPTGFDHWKCPLAAALQKLPCHCEPVRAWQSPAVLYALNDSQKEHRSIPYVILSERSESKDLRTVIIFAVKSVRRSFDSGLCPPLRMTEGDDARFFCFTPAVIQVGRRGQCRTPYQKQEKHPIPGCFFNNHSAVPHSSTPRNFLARMPTTKDSTATLTLMSAISAKRRLKG